GDSTDPNKVHALNGIIIRLIQAQLLGNRKFEIWGTGKPVREWVYIADVARILVDSIAMEEQVYPLNLAQNKAYSIAEIAEFEAALAERLKLRNPVALNSGTSALHLALALAGVGPEDEVILPAQTFVATGLVVLMQGATPVFADIDPATGNLCPESLRRKVT